MAYLIKRYSNRKLYDSQKSRYVALKELEGLIRGGVEIAVVDATTGQDLTSVTLTQIILENERHHRSILPAAFLHQLIKHGQDWQDFAHRSLGSRVQEVATSQPGADRILREWAMSVGLIPPKKHTISSETAQGSTPGTETPRNEIETLRQRLRELEEQLERREGQ